MIKPDNYYGVCRKGFVKELENKTIFMLAKGECLEKNLHLHKVNEDGFRQRVWENPELANHQIDFRIKLFNKEPV